MLKMSRKQKTFRLLVTLICIFFASTVVASNHKEIPPINSPLPKESLFYAVMFDNVCTTKTSYKINASWVQELKHQLPHWKALWNQEGMQLLETTTALIERPFVQENFQVALSLCSFPSMSAPLIVNARYALHSFTNNPISGAVLINTIYHEILHNYIDSFLPKNTSLLLKYSKESPGVLSHLHLFALEKAVYLKLGWQSTLNAVIAKDNSLPNNDYKRAWEIINQKENYHDFVDELKKFSNSQTLYPDMI